MIPSPLMTERLQLRPAHPGDAERLFKYYYSDTERARFLTRKSHAQFAQTLSFLKRWCEDAWVRETPQFSWVIALQTTNEAIGVFLVITKAREAQIHYGISRTFEGQGLITEAGSAVVGWLEKQSRIEIIWTVCDVENYASIRVLEKLGFENQGLLKNWLQLPAFGEAPRDCYKFLKLKNGQAILIN